MDSVTKMKRSWEGEDRRVEPIQKELAIQRTKIEARAAEFGTTLHKLQIELDQTSVLEESCQVCRPLPDEPSPAS
jgi:hypothetical protein